MNISEERSNQLLNVTQSSESKQVYAEWKLLDGLSGDLEMTLKDVPTQIKPADLADMEKKWAATRLAVGIMTTAQSLFKPLAAHLKKDVICKRTIEKLDEKGLTLTKNLEDTLKAAAQM